MQRTESESNYYSFAAVLNPDSVLFCYFPEKKLDSVQHNVFVYFVVDNIIIG